MNLGQMRQGVYDRAGVPTTDATLTTQAVDGYLNSSMHQIESVQDWPWLLRRDTITTVAGTTVDTNDLYSPPADWLRTRQLRIANYGPLTRYEVHELEDVWPDTAQGIPQAWCADADFIRVRPFPDAVYTIRHLYVRIEPDLSSDTQSPLMPAKFHSAIVEGATWLALRSDREDVRGAAAKAEFDRWLNVMRDDARRGSSPGRVRVRPGGAL
jgi:hypothetical protein